MPGNSAIPLTELDAEYARLNSVKTVGDARDSAFAIHKAGSLTVTVDENRVDSYYNRVLGLKPESLSSLDAALELLSASPKVRIDSDLSDREVMESPLRARGFAPVAKLNWLSARPRVSSHPAVVIRLGPDERDRVREVLELRGAIDDDLWADRRSRLCTETFRAFAVESDNGIAAMATTFIGEHGAIFGNAFTRVEWRGRGFQRALLQARLNDAANLGLDLVVTDVEPGTTSERNCQRAGFSLFCEQLIWER